MASKKKIDETPAPTSLAEALERVADPKATLLAIVDRAVRDSRENGWCDSFESIMDRVAPELAVATVYDRRTYGPGSTYVDSDGFSCNGYDVEGYNAQGLHFSTGRDRDGFDRRGFNELGLDREGRNEYGEDANDPSTVYRFRWQSASGTERAGRYDTLIDWDGFDPNGYRATNRHGDYITRRDMLALRAQGVEAFNLDRNGNAAPVAASK